MVHQNNCTRTMDLHSRVSNLRSWCTPTAITDGHSIHLLKVRIDRSPSAASRVPCGCRCSQLIALGLDEVLMQLPTSAIGLRQSAGSRHIGNQPHHIGLQLCRQGQQGQDHTQISSVCDARAKSATTHEYSSTQTTQVLSGV